MTQIGERVFDSTESKQTLSRTALSLGQRRVKDCPWHAVLTQAKRLPGHGGQHCVKQSAA